MSHGQLHRGEYDLHVPLVDAHVRAASRQDVEWGRPVDISAVDFHAENARVRTRTALIRAHNGVIAPKAEAGSHDKNSISANVEVAIGQVLMTAAGSRSPRSSASANSKARLDYPALPASYLRSRSRSTEAQTNLRSHRSARCDVCLRRDQQHDISAPGIRCETMPVIRRRQLTLADWLTGSRRVAPASGRRHRGSHCPAWLTAELRRHAPVASSTTERGDAVPKLNQAVFRRPCWLLPEW